MPVRISPSTIEAAMRKSFRAGISKVSLTWNLGITRYVARTKNSLAPRLWCSV